MCAYVTTIKLITSCNDDNPNHLNSFSDGAGDTAASERDNNCRSNNSNNLWVCLLIVNDLYLRPINEQSCFCCEEKPNQELISSDDCPERMAVV